MSYGKVFTAILCLLFCTSFCTAQNYSGLQNKKLLKADDLGSALESLIGRIGGSIDGNIDSVVVTHDYEKELRLRIYYTGFDNGYFTVSTMSDGRRVEQWVTPVKFTQAERTSPAEVILPMNDKLPLDAMAESPYLRIDIAKSSNGGGKVKVFLLQKTWKAFAGTGGVGSGSGTLTHVSLQPVGVAATLTETPVDVPLPKMIFFDPKKKYEIRDNRKGTIKSTEVRDHRTGGNAFQSLVKWSDYFSPDDIAGTWMNKDQSGNGISYLTITNNQLTVMSKSASDGHLYSSANGNLTAVNATTYNCTLVPRLPADAQKYTQTMNLVFNGDNLRVKHVIKTKSIFPTTTTVIYDFYRKIKPVTVRPVFPVVMDPVTPVTPVSTEELGPNKDKPQNLWDGIAVDNDVDFGRPQDLSNINMTVYPDKNPHSGTWYILPADYHLLWDPSVEARNGYGLFISYDVQADGSPDVASVLIKAILTAGINNREKNFVRSLLKVKDPEFRDIKYIPLRENIASTFQSTLGAQYNIPPEKISVTSSTDLENTVTVAWRTNPDTKEFIQTALTSGEGIVASMILKPREQQIVDQQIDAIISLSNTTTLGKMELEPLTWRTKDWTNLTAYTLKLKYLHVLRKSTLTNKPIVYSWSIDNTEVPSQGRVSFDNSRVPKWLDNDPSSLMWLSYSVNECDSCNADLITDLTGGVSGNTVQQVRFIIPDQVFDTLKANYFVITVRSIQADPKGQTVIELPVVNITKDPGKNFLVGPLFVPRNGAPDFEYNIKIASTDGDFYRSDKWIRSTEKNIYLGKTDLKELFRGIIPGLN